MDVYKSFLKRMESGELDPGENFSERTKHFAKEVIANTEQGYLTGKQATALWFHHLKRLGHNVEIPEIE